MSLVPSSEIKYHAWLQIFLGKLKAIKTLILLPDSYLITFDNHLPFLKMYSLKVEIKEKLKHPPVAF